jgi:hypothetical protein
LYVPTNRLPHGEQVAEARLLLQLAGEFHAREQPDQARRYARRALVIFQRVWGPDHLDSVTALVTGAEARQQLGDHEHAEAEYVEAIGTLDEIAEDFDARELMILRTRVVRGLARAVYASGHYRESERILIDGLRMAREVLGVMSPEVGGLIKDLGAIHHPKSA